MNKSKVFIASSERALTLAEVVSKELGTTGFCEARLWTEASKGQPSKTKIEIVENASQTYDFAVIVLAKDDVKIKDAGEALKARDNCIFEAGLFMGGLGRERCFLLNSVPRNELPTDLSGINCIDFDEPQDLTDRDQCSTALSTAVSKIKDDIQSAQKNGEMARNKLLVNLLSAKDLLARESLDRKTGGKLEEGQVVVTAIQPVETRYLPALQVRKNIDKGVSYVYFFHGDEDGANKICWLLQMVLLAPLFENEVDGNDFTARRKMLGEKRNKILEDLETICRSKTLKIVALPDQPILEYCIHNADNVDTSTVYIKYGDKFLEWAEGPSANRFWKEVKQHHIIKPKPTLALFYETVGMSGEKQKNYYDSIDDHIVKYFPQIENDVRRFCVEGIPRKR